MCNFDQHFEYARAELGERDVDPDPISQFQRWFDAALAAAIAEPLAMTLATATRSGRPSARIVLLKGVDADGFVLYTNYESRKGRELTENPYAALVLYWAPLERQVRVTGHVSRLSRDDSARYFHSRPVGSQLGAWASRQSHVITGREELDRRLATLQEQYRDHEIPLPPYWGGLRVTPDEIEFWQGRPNRLHDRLLYTRAGDNTWRIERLSP